MNTATLAKTLKLIKIDNDLENTDLASILGVSLEVAKNYSMGRTKIKAKHLDTLKSKFPAYFNDDEHRDKAGHRAVTAQKARLLDLASLIFDDLTEPDRDILERLDMLEDKIDRIQTKLDLMSINQ